MATNQCSSDTSSNGGFIEYMSITSSIEPISDDGEYFCKKNEIKLNKFERFKNRKIKTQQKPECMKKWKRYKK